MTGPYEKTINRFRGGPDPFDDALVVVWDAVVRGEPATPEGCDPADTVVLRWIHALETIPPPSGDFFGNLERQLASLASQPAVESSTRTTASTFESMRSAAIATPRVPWSRGDAESSGAPPAGGRNTAFPGATRRFLSMPAAAAVLALLLIAGPLVFYLAHGTPSEPPAIPAAVVPPAAMETLMQLDFSPSQWNLPAATTWDHLELSMFVVDPDASFSTDIPWYTSVEGPLTIVVLNGELSFQPLGPALLYRGGSSSGAPVEQAAGESVSLGPNDAIVFSSAVPATGINPGSEPALILIGLAGAGGDVTLGTVTDPADLTRVDVNLDEHLSPLPAEAASVSIWHLQLAPLDTFVYNIAPGLRIVPIYIPLQINDLRIYDGALDPLAPDLTGRSHLASRAFLLYPDPGPHTLVNISDETVDLYFLVAEPYPATATPAT